MDKMNHTDRQLVRTNLVAVTMLDQHECGGKAQAATGVRMSVLGRDANTNSRCSALTASAALIAIAASSCLGYGLHPYALDSGTCLRR